MIPIRDNLESRDRPLVTWTLIALNVLLFFWDRDWSLGGHSIVFADLAMRPREVLSAVTGSGDPLELDSAPEAVWIDGVRQPLDNHQTRLRDRYRSLEREALPEAYRK